MSDIMNELAKAKTKCRNCIHYKRKRDVHNFDNNYCMIRTMFLSNDNALHCNDFLNKYENNIVNEVSRKFGYWFVNVWQQEFVCPVCKTKNLDLSEPRKLTNPIVCLHCYNQFKLQRVDK